MWGLYSISQIQIFEMKCSIHNRHKHCKFGLKIVWQHYKLQSILCSQSNKKQHFRVFGTGYKKKNTISAPFFILGYWINIMIVFALCCVLNESAPLRAPTPCPHSLSPLPELTPCPH